MSDEFIQIITTTSSRDEAERLSRTLIERQLAGCVQVVGPIESTYRWENKIETATEWQCWIKTRRQNYSSVEKVIHEIHSYEVPEILALPVIAGSERYMRWLAEAAPEKR